MMTGIRKKHAYEEIVAQIQDLITKGRWRREHRLPTEKELSETFKVSRSTVREALLLLKTIGLVERRQGQGTYVIGACEETRVHPLANALFDDEDDLVDIFCLRKIIEPAVAYIAAENATSEEIAELEIILVEQKKSLANQDREAHMDAMFHHLLVGMAKNRILERLSLVLQNLLRESLAERLVSEQRRIESLRGHQRILDAVKARNGRSARRAMIKHLEEIEKTVFVKKGR